MRDTKANSLKPLRLGRPKDAGTGVLARPAHLMSTHYSHPSVSGTL